MTVRSTDINRYANNQLGSLWCEHWCIYKQIKPPLVGEHAFPLTGFVCLAAHVTFGGSGGILVTYNYHVLRPIICCK